MTAKGGKEREQSRGGGRVSELGLLFLSSMNAASFCGIASQPGPGGASATTDADDDDDDDGSARSCLPEWAVAAREEGEREGRK